MKLKTTSFRYLLAFLLCGWMGLAHSANLDSLKGIWLDITESDTNRLKAISIIINSSINSNLDSSLYYSEILYELAVFTNNKKWIAKAYHFQGLIHQKRNKFDKAISYYDSSIKIKEKFIDKTALAMTYINLGNIFQKQGNYLKSISYFQESLKVFEINNNILGKGKTLVNLGNLYYRQASYDKALNYYLDALDFLKQTDSKIDLAAVYGNISGIHYHNDHYEEAMKFSIKALRIDEELNIPFSISRTFNNIGMIYEKKGNYSDAIKYYNKCLKISINNNIKIGVILSYKSMGNINFIQGNYKQCSFYANKSFNLANEIGNTIQIKELSELLYKYYKKTKKPSEALKMYELYIRLKDSIMSDENTRALIQHEYQYEYEKEKALEEATYQEEVELVREREKRQQLISYGTGGGLILLLAFAFTIFNRLQVANKQKKVITKKNKNITDSINYAQRIQRATLTSQDYLDKTIEDYFVLYHPKDIVGGDFYWVYKLDDGTIMVAVGDCTGHGVPGGFMSMLGVSLLNEIVVENNITEVNLVLERMRTQIIKNLKQGEDRSKSKDGMDISLISFDPKTNKLQFAGAGHKLYLAENEECSEIQGDRFPVGYYMGKEAPFSTKEIQLKKNTCIYLSSDGFPDQFGGENRKKYGRTNLIKLFSSIQNKSMEEQKATIENTLAEWKGYNDQIDDIVVMGIRFPIS